MYSYLEWLYDVILIAFEEVCPHFAVLIDPLPANCKPAPGHCWSPIGCNQLIELKVIFHNVDAVVPVQWIVQHNCVGLFDRIVTLYQSQFMTQIHT